MISKNQTEKQHNDLIADCGAYFRAHDEYSGAFEAMKRKWKKYGRVAGIIKMEDISQKERRALEGFFSREFSGNSAQFSMVDFEKSLQKTKFCGVSLEQLLSEYFQEELLTNQEKKQMALQQREQFFYELCEDVKESYGESSSSFKWLSAAIREKKYGYQLILGEYAVSPEDGKKQVQIICHAISFLEHRKGVRLAVLASEITGNPHAFDRSTALGKLLIRALSFLNEGVDYRSAEDILSLYYTAGIKPDDVSSFTVMYGVHLHTQEGEHPAYWSFIDNGEPYVVTLSNLGRIKSAKIKGNCVYVVENQMVFSQLCESLQGKERAVLCTSGQVKTASLILIDMLCEAGYKLVYSGDFDPEGLMIAERLLTRHENSIELWHMAEEDYEHCLSEEDIPEERLHKLDKITTPKLAEVKKLMLQRKKAGYQERLIDKMLEDIVNLYR